MPIPFFCAVCDKPLITKCKNKYATIHEKCMEEYLDKNKFIIEDKPKRGERK